MIGIDVSIRRNLCLKFWKHGYCDVTLSASNDIRRHLYQLSATSNINYCELRHGSEKRFSLSYQNLVFISYQWKSPLLFGKYLKFYDQKIKEVFISGRKLLCSYSYYRIDNKRTVPCFVSILFSLCDSISMDSKLSENFMVTVKLVYP